MKMPNLFKGQKIRVILLWGGGSFIHWLNTEKTVYYYLLTSKHLKVINFVGSLKGH